MLKIHLNEEGNKANFSIIKNIGTPIVYFYNKKREPIAEEVTFISDSLWQTNFDNDVYNVNYFCVKKQNGDIFIDSKPPVLIDVDTVDPLGRQTEQEDNYTIRLQEFPQSSEIFDELNNKHFFINAFGSLMGHYTYLVNEWISDSGYPDIYTLDEYNDFLNNRGDVFEKSGIGVLIDDMGLHGSFSVPFSDGVNVVKADYPIENNIDFYRHYSVGYPYYEVYNMPFNRVTLTKTENFLYSTLSFSNRLHTDSSSGNLTDLKFNSYYNGISRYVNTDAGIDTGNMTQPRSLDKFAGGTTDPIRDINYQALMRFEVYVERFAHRNITTGTHLKEKEEHFSI